MAARVVTRPRDRLVAALHARGITDARVLAAIAEVPREEFVPAALAARAYDDVPLGIGCGQTISQPLVVAMTIAALELTGDERVLEVGTGSGYSAAVLARLAARVARSSASTSCASRPRSGSRGSAMRASRSTAATARAACRRARRSMRSRSRRRRRRCRGRCSRSSRSAGGSSCRSETRSSSGCCGSRGAGWMTT